MGPGFRPATEAEYRDDYAKRVAAIERAEAEGTHSPRQIKDAHETLLTFRGYPRPVEKVGPCTAERPFGWHCTMRCERKADHDGPHKAQCFTWDEYMCICPAYRFNEQGDVEGLPQGTNPDCRHCHPEDTP